MRFNALPRDAAEEELLACCASRRWAAAVLAGRPFGSADDLVAAAGAAARELEWPDVEEALRAHPRIGERPSGGGRSAVWSRAEQSGVDAGDGVAPAELATANAAYEERFGHVFLICASGRDAVGILAELRERLANDPDDERLVVRDELAKIAVGRLRRILA